MGGDRRELAHRDRFATGRLKVPTFYVREGEGDHPLHRVDEGPRGQHEHESEGDPNERRKRSAGGSEEIAEGEAAPHRETEEVAGQQPRRTAGRTGGTGTNGLRRRDAGGRKRGKDACRTRDEDADSDPDGHAVAVEPRRYEGYAELVRAGARDERVGEVVEEDRSARIADRPHEPDLGPLGLDMSAGSRAIGPAVPTRRGLPLASRGLLATWALPRARG